MGKKRAVSEPESDYLNARVLRSKQAVLAAAGQLLKETGLGGVSVDEVSARSGVAKTTIYRHWPTRTALLLETCSHQGVKLVAPDTGNLKADLTALAQEMANRLSSRKFSSVLPSIVDAAERDPEIAKVHAKLHAGHMAPMYEVLTRARERGDLPRGTDSSEIVASIVGPLFYRRWFSRETIDAKFVKGVVERAISKCKNA